MITIEQQPYEWSARGQKLIYRASSTETAQPGFKYTVKAYDTFSNKEYNFIYDGAIFDEKLYFDLQPLVYLRNWENSSGKYIIPHYTPFDEPLDEPYGNGYNEWQVDIGEGWLIDGVFTPDTESVVSANVVQVFNAYVQPFYGFRPDPAGDVYATRYALNSEKISYAWSDRFIGTHAWDYYPYFNPILQGNSVFIPAYNSDWGAIAYAGCYQGGLLQSNTTKKIKVELYYNNAASSVDFDVITSATAIDVYPFLHVGVYPQNLKAGGAGVPDPTAYNWDFYIITILDNTDDPVNIPYVFYNADKYGQHDCKNDIIRIAWVSMRGGWDYFNFIKRSEITNQVDRKQFTRRLNNNSSGIFYPNQRQTIDTVNLTERTITVNSDWIQENEFVYLKNLFNSNQIHWLTRPTIYPLSNDTQNPETAVPVSLIDTSFTEQRGRNGKLVNVTLKFKITQDFWT